MGKSIELVCGVEVLEGNFRVFGEEERDEWEGERRGDEALGTTLSCYKHTTI